MPPKAAPEPPPIEEPEDTGPKISPEELLARRMGMNPKREDPQVEILLERSAGISSDPKMAELNGMLSSHTTEVGQRTKGSTPLGRSRCSLRTNEIDKVDRRMKDLEHGSLARPTSRELCGRPSLGSPSSSPSLMRKSESSPTLSSFPVSPKFEDLEKAAQAAQTKMARFDSNYHRHQFQHTTDKTLKRLLIDMDLANPSQQKHYSHQTRCDHLDKMHNWYSKHTYKDKNESQQEKRMGAQKPPPYLVFSQEGPVSPGSLRVQSKHPSPLLSAASLHRHGAASPAMSPSCGSPSYMGSPR